MQRRNKILAVDDNQTNLAIIAELLEEDYDLKTAASGEQALEMARDFEPDLILLDIMMPGIDGYEVCRRFRQDPYLKHAKIIMVSARAMLAERLKGYEVGADDYIVKPFEEDELLAKVRVYLRLKSVEEVDQLKSNLLDLLGHETRTPLTGIISPAELLMLDKNLDSEKQKALIEMLYRNSKRLFGLFEKIVKLCALKSGKYEFDLEFCNLCDVVDDVICGSQESASQRNVTIEKVLDETTRIYLDTGEVKKVIASVLDNAIRFSPADAEIMVRVFSENGCGCVSVADCGPGIAADFLPHVFDELSDADVAHHSEGQGLSMAIAREVIVQHGGTITAESTEGAGATFIVRLPITEQQETIAQAAYTAEVAKYSAAAR